MKLCIRYAPQQCPLFRAAMAHYDGRIDGWKRQWRRLEQVMASSSSPEFSRDIREIQNKVEVTIDRLVVRKRRLAHEVIHDRQCRLYRAEFDGFDLCPTVPV